MKRILYSIAALTLLSSTALADIRLPAIFTDHLVLQQGQKNRVWGWADPGEEVIVTIAGQKHTAKADDKGKWLVTLDALAVGGPHTLNLAGKNKLAVQDILVGEVWICSGQSNMQWEVKQSNDADLEAKTAKYPKIRFISVPQVGTQTPQADFKGSWSVCSPDTVGNLSAVGYFFGRTLHQTLDVPIGLIDDAWGGSACEAWVRRDILAKDEKYKPLLDYWQQIETTLADPNRPQAKGAKGGPNPGMLTGNARPGNIYNGVLKPTIGYGIKGAIWYQGETNAGRAYQYRDLFPLMIQTWRDEWQQGDFPFYWVQLADYQAEKPQPGDSAWAELREAQTLTMDKLKNTGEAVIIDVGEGRDIHPRNKQAVAQRLARWALARDYGLSDLAHQSPRYKSLEKQPGKLVLTIDHVGEGLYTFDQTKPVGFAIAGSDQKFVWADAVLEGKDKIVVSSKDVPEPVAARYAWADNPVCNVYGTERISGGQPGQRYSLLPLTPFRTDDWKGVTADKKAP